MKGYRKASGVYIEVPDETPVNAALVEVALRPSVNHVFAVGWQAAPLDPAVCWRTKTAPETNAEKNAELQAFLDSAGGKVVKSIGTVLIQKNVLTLAEIQAAYRALA